MCKAPIAGRVKTRLQPEYSPAQAAAVHAAMARTFIEKIARLFPSAWVAADLPTHPFFAGFGLTIMPQGSGDLGARMSRMLLLALDYGAEGVLFTGTDSPHMSDARLLAAIRALVHVDVVIGPAEDGGYDLIGVRGAYLTLFSDIPWSTASVCDTTLARAQEAGLRYRCLSTGFDVDAPADVQRSQRILGRRMC